MPSYKLRYLDVRARGEYIRLLFAEAQVKYEDERISFEDWPNKKSEMPFGQVPVLEIDGKKMCQSRSIIRYLAREFGLDGSTALQAGFADMLVESVDEVIYKLPFRSKLQGKSYKEEADKVFKENIYPVFDKIEKTYKDHGWNFMIGKDVFTYADLFMLNACQTACKFDENFLERYPGLKAHTEQVAARPNIRKWLDTRPDNPV